MQILNLDEPTDQELEEEDEVCHLVMRVCGLCVRVFECVVCDVCVCVCVV